jgi:hypothetical protein
MILLKGGRTMSTKCLNRDSKTTSKFAIGFFLLAGTLSMTSCKFNSSGYAKLAVVSLPDNQIRAKHCKGAKPVRLARQAVYTIGNTSILSISSSVCDAEKKGFSLAGGSSHKTIIITGEPGSQADSQKELVTMYENVDPGLVKVDLSQLPKDAKTADVEGFIKSQVSSQLPNGYTGDLDVVYNGHGGSPKTVKPPINGSGGDVMDHVTFPQDSGVPMASVLNSAAEGARGGRAKTGKTIAVVNSCYAGQNKAFIENSASAAAQCQRESFDGIVYPASAEQPLWGPSMIKLNQEYIELRKNGYSPGYDGNKDGRVTLDEFQEGVQPKIGINTQGFTDRIAIGAASYIMLDAESKAAIYNPEVEVYNGDLVIGERPVASASW